MRNNLLAQKYAFISAMLFILLMLSFANNAKAQQQMYAPESATAVQVDIANATVKTTQGSRIVIETTVQYANGRTATVISESIKPVISETNGVVTISQPKTVKVNNENVTITYKVFVPKSLSVTQL
jgi:hypothetical protein